MASLLLKSGVTAEWGTDGAGSSAIGIISDCDIEVAAEEAELPDKNGEAVGLSLFNEKNECNVGIIAVTAATLPDIGDSITLGGVAAIVKKVKQLWEAKGFKKVQIAATKYANSLV